MTEEEKENEESITRVPIKFVVEGIGEADGELIRHLAPRTVGTIIKNLPMEGRAALWKEEIYFELPIGMGDEKAKPKVEKGTIAYWPMGSAMCIFYGETQPYSPVNIVGKITENLEIFASVKSGTRIKVTAR
ncbi:MAG: cyclophilin-like fold protein [Candidatus Bathyarchaeota archaeon]|nr:cyclophilin-like fold protein [Candidatus Bathyarchaeota archaeon]